MSEARELPQLREAFGLREQLADYAELAKMRITSMVAITTAAGFYLGSRGPVDLAVLAWTILGTALVSAAACALNQVLEIDLDARMRRTEHRPLPARRLTPMQATLFACVLALAGVAVLWAKVNLLTAVLAAGCLLFYLLVYTPLKTRTTANTILGAVAGAIPPVMGWTGATGELGAPALVLFGILFLWQLPHFFAIASLYREDYASAGFRMLPVVDSTGVQTAVQTLGFTLALVVVAAMPHLLGLAGMPYLLGSLVLGFVFFAFGVGMARDRSRQSARRLLLASVVYLPALLGLLVLDKIPG
ncbi:MAG: protoheme IX farnesyltransferase [Planctomycetes bacterium]|nr:protoheme IX farnesyltransferase [Planctomycetota bacterium]